MIPRPLSLSFHYYSLQKRQKIKENGLIPSHYHSVTMTSGQMVTYEAALIPLLLGKQGCNITFVLESSENMRAVLGSVKHLLIQTLLNKASHRDSLFNIMSFSSKVRGIW